jgi:hypothetical protein
MPRIPNDETNSAAAGAAAEEGRRPTLVASPAAASPELSDRPQRRNFGAKYKLQILDEIDRAAGTPGAIGAILRREGIYSSSITEWRRLRATGAYEGLSPVKRGPKPMAPNPVSAEHAQMEREHKRLQQLFRGNYDGRSASTMMAGRGSRRVVCFGYHELLDGTTWIGD